jgi:hypothetical protein
MSERTGTDGDRSIRTHGDRIHERSRVLSALSQIVRVLAVAVVTSRPAAAVRWFDQKVMIIVRVVDRWVTASVVWSLLFAIPSDGIRNVTVMTSLLSRLRRAVRGSRVAQSLRSE